MGFGSVAPATSETAHLGVVFRTDDELARIRAAHVPSR